MLRRGSSRMPNSHLSDIQRGTSIIFVSKPNSAFSIINNCDVMFGIIASLLNWLLTPLARYGGAPGTIAPLANRTEAQSLSARAEAQMRRGATGLRSSGCSPPPCQTMCNTSSPSLSSRELSYFLVLGLPTPFLCRKPNSDFFF